MRSNLASAARSALINIGYRAIAHGIRVRVPADAKTFSQCSHLIDLISRLNINVFLDVGANRGFFSKHLRMAGYRGRLISFEPIPEHRKHIEELAAGDTNWTICDYALGAQNGNEQFQVNMCGSETVLSSFLKLKGAVDGDRSIEVKVLRLDGVLPELIADMEAPRIFLKMDTQGFDNQVFEGATGILEKIVGIQSEISVIPLYDGMPHYTESLKMYEKAGFSLINLFVVDRTKDGCVIEYDCVMMRTPQLSCDQLFSIT